MARRRPGAAEKTVLFVGNSFTARNDLPGLVAGLAAARGKNLRHRLIASGGASLRTHWNAGEALQAIREEAPDAVVLQEQSTLPVKNARRMHENVRLFDGAICDAGAATVLYMTWARRHAPETQRAITDAYAGIGRELGAVVVPVGVAWQAVLRGRDAPDLFDRDGSHPAPAGSYLAACAFLAVLFDENPVGIDSEVPGLGETGRDRLQTAAWQAVSKQANKLPLRSSAKKNG